MSEHCQHRDAPNPNGFERCICCARDAGIWWRVKVFDPETRTTTTLEKFGTLQDIKIDLLREGEWVFVSAYPAQNEAQP